MLLLPWIMLRNLLVKKEDGTYIVKIADFGLSRSLYANEYYNSESDEFAKKWSGKCIGCGWTPLIQPAPEVILYHKFSTMSDVYSFSVMYLLGVY